MKLKVIESNLLVVDWVIYWGGGVIYYTKLKILQSNLLAVDWEIYYWGGNLLHKIGNTSIKLPCSILR